MTLQVLVATMDQSDHSLLDKMNINSDVIVGNQCSVDSVERFDYKGHSAVYLNFAERGVGLNRNNALMRAEADVCIFADDDVVYYDGYSETVINAFHENPEADIILFNIDEEDSKRYRIQKKHRVGRFNYLRYGTVRIAVRLKSIKENGIYFNQTFGGGTEHCHGEDNLFLNACLNKGLKIIALPISVLQLKNERMSSWNRGYDKKYLEDQGHLYHALSPRFWRLLCLQDSFRRRHSYRDVATVLEAYRIMVSSVRSGG